MQTTEAPSRLTRTLRALVFIKTSSHERDTEGRSVDPVQGYDSGDEFMAEESWAQALVESGQAVYVSGAFPVDPPSGEAKPEVAQ